MFDARARPLTTPSIEQPERGLSTVTVVVAVLNAVTTIAATIESLLTQEGDPPEVVVVDGASTDGTVQVLESFRSRLQVYISEPDGGIYDAMNKGLRAATHEWVIFMNAGDVFAAPDVLARMRETLAGSYHVVCGDFAMTWRSYAVHFAVRPLEGGRMPTQHQAIFVRRAVALRHPFRTTFRVAADYDQLRRMVGAGASIGYTRVLIARVAAGGFSSINARLAIVEFREIIAQTDGPLAAWTWYVPVRLWTAGSALIRNRFSEPTIGRLRRWRHALAGRSATDSAAEGPTPQSPR